MINSRDVNLLHWKMRDKCKELIENCKKRGVTLLVTSTVRDDEYQQSLYAQGRTKPGNIVTYLKTPTFHSNKVGLAFDVVPLNSKGRPNWNDIRAFNIAGEEGVKLGLTWGGNWTKFVDSPHFQLGEGLSSKDIRAGKRPEWFYDPEPTVVKAPLWKEKAVQWGLETGMISEYHDPLEPLDIGTYLEIERKKALRK